MLFGMLIVSCFIQLRIETQVITVCRITDWSHFNARRSSMIAFYVSECTFTVDLRRRQITLRFRYFIIDQLIIKQYPFINCQFVIFHLCMWIIIHYHLGAPFPFFPFEEHSLFSSDVYLLIEKKLAAFIELFLVWLGVKQDFISIIEVLLLHTLQIPFKNCHQGSYICSAIPWNNIYAFTLVSWRISICFLDFHTLQCEFWDWRYSEQAYHHALESGLQKLSYFFLVLEHLWLTFEIFLN